ncbi:MAG: B12-binding domain-containing protein [Gemmatales bacterium]|nr:B12-binding domain-containing protein [Gemmatales bacterium]MDW8387720.1 B12-binding domain-containing protein [Gemmatales bacterium]
MVQQAWSSKYLSTAQVAQALGVGVSTVKRWVDEGLLPALRTAGGHRKLLVADVLRLVRSGQLPGVDITALGASDIPTRERLRQRLYTALERGDSRTVQRIVLGSYRSGLPLDVLADEVVAPAMHQVGHGWETGRLDVYEEHRGTQIIAAALFALKALLEKTALRNMPVALGGAPEGDYTLLPSLLAELILMDLGWKVVNLGPNTPAASFRKAIEEIRPKLVWVSAAHGVESAEAQAELIRVAETASRLGAAIIFGGRGFPAEFGERMGPSHFGNRLADLANLAKSLHPLPSRPRRGRPPKTARRR